ncbi:MAG: hypothetical protein ACO1OB_13015, partial [Archangium sp.]
QQGGVGDCIPQSMLPQRPAGGSDTTCLVETTLVAVPAVGLQLFGNSACNQPPTVRDSDYVRSTHFGNYQWFVSATSQGFTVSSPVISKAITARLELDGGTQPLVPEQCNYLQVFARGAGGVLAYAAVDTSPSITISQNATLRQGCGETKFLAGSASMVVGVQPVAGGDVTLTISSPLFTTGISRTIPVCKLSSAACASPGECCSGICGMGMVCD